MRKSLWFPLLLIAAAILILVYVFSSRPKPSAAASPATPPPAIASPTIPRDSLTLNRRLGTNANEAQVDQIRAGETDPDLIGVKDVLRGYRAAFGENPVGTNAEITRALTGANSRKSNFGGDEVKIKDGQTVDRWGHPYFFHQLSRTEMEIRSAGPDGAMWTQDDEVIR